MSILTKISVVVLALVVLLAMPVFIMQSVLPTVWKKAWQDQKNQNKLLQVNHRQAEQALTAANADVKRLTREVELVRDERDSISKDLNRDLETVKRDLATEKNNNTQLLATIRGLEDTIKLMEQQRVVIENELKVLRTENGRLGTVVRRLESQRQEMQAEMDRLSKLVDLQREQVAEREEQIRDLQQQVIDMQTKGAAAGVVAAGAGPGGAAVTGGGRAEQMTTDPATRIDGTVTSVREDLAGVNIGSAKGLQRGMKLKIFRGSEFVGYLRVQEVGIDEAAGIVIEQRLQPVKGDKVTNKLID